MPQVGKSGEPVHEAASYGWDGTDWVKLSVNAGGEVVQADCLVPTSLAEGQVQVALTTMYTVPASTQIGCVQILLYNSHDAAVVVTLSLTKSAGTEREVLEVSLTDSQSYVFHIEGLSAADLIRGIADVDDKVNYFMSGQVQA